MVCLVGINIMVGIGIRRTVLQKMNEIPIIAG